MIGLLVELLLRSSDEQATVDIRAFFVGAEEENTLSKSVVVR